MRLKIKIIVFSILLVFLAGCQSHIKKYSQKTLPDSAFFIVDQKKVTQPVIKLMELTDLNIPLSLDDAVFITQKNWLRKQDQERVDLLESNHKSLSMMKEQFERLGLTKTITPKKSEYDYVIILGAMYEPFKDRLHFLEHLAKSINFKKLALLGSLRPLEREQELSPLLKSHAFLKLPMTEIEMMEELLKKSSIDVGNIEIIRIASPMKRGPDNSLKRANTLDTVLDFKNLKLKPGFALVISSQPHILRQELVVLSELKAPWQIETVGPKPPKDSPTDVYLDELARILYELKKN